MIKNIESKYIEDFFFFGLKSISNTKHVLFARRIVICMFNVGIWNVSKRLVANLLYLKLAHSYVGDSKMLL